MSDEPADLADLADLVLTVAREIQLRGFGDTGALALTATEGNVMRYIDRHPGSTPRVVAAATGVQPSNLSATLRSLEEKGLIERVVDATDGRSARLRPLPFAAENLERVRASWVAFLGPVLEGVDAEAIRSTIELLELVEAGIVTARLA